MLLVNGTRMISVVESKPHYQYTNLDIVKHYLRVLFFITFMRGQQQYIQYIVRNAYKTVDM